jgi:protein SCO1
VNSVRGANRADLTAAAALLASAAALLPMFAERAHAHDAAPVTRKADAPAPVVARTRWGADYFSNVPLTTQDGTTVRLYDDLLKGKSVAINVMYTSCKDECPLETARLVQLQRVLGERMGKDIFFYSITIDPKTDTPKVLKAYAEKFGVGPGWLFLTGKEEDIKLVGKKLGLSRKRDSVRKDGHSASLMVGNEPAGLWMRNSAVDNPQFLATTIGNFLGWKDAAPRNSYAEARPLVLDPGEYFFQSQCSACHTVGQGDKMGPDLLGVTARRDRAWLNRYIMAPDKLLAEGDPVAVALFEKYQYARMPNLRLSQDEAAAVLSYIEGRKASISGR